MYLIYSVETIIEFTRTCSCPEDDGYLALLFAVVFDLSADDAIRLVSGLRKRL